MLRDRATHCGNEVMYKTNSIWIKNNTWRNICEEQAKIFNHVVKDIDRNILTHESDCRLYDSCQKEADTNVDAGSSEGFDNFKIWEDLRRKISTMEQIEASAVGSDEICAWGQHSKFTRSSWRDLCLRTTQQIHTILIICASEMQVLDSLLYLIPSFMLMGRKSSWRNLNGKIDCCDSCVSTPNFRWILLALDIKMRAFGNFWWFCKNKCLHLKDTRIWKMRESQTRSLLQANGQCAVVPASWTFRRSQALQAWGTTGEARPVAFPPSTWPGAGRRWRWRQS